MLDLLKTQINEWQRMNNQNPNETRFEPKEAIPVGYNEKVPIEFFDFLVIDECHRSIYNLWKQVLDYFDVFQIGLTATSDNRMFGYFNLNLVKKISFAKKSPTEVKKTQKCLATIL